jgi:aldose 1-epimerase
MRAAAVAAMAALCGCTSAPPPEKSMLKKEGWGAVDGAPVTLYTLSNAKGMEARVTNYGATLVSVLAPDRTGSFADVLLGHDDLAGYRDRNRYFGSVVGRYGNRIAKGRFKLGGVEYTLATNNGPNHLHGGLKGFDKAVWSATEAETPDGPSVTMKYVSKDGEEGYPGTLTAQVTYTLTASGALRLDFQWTSDKDTVANLTNHAYFNLTGKGEGEITGHEIRIAASRFTPVDAGLIPTGELRPVADTPFDFRTAMSIGARIDDPKDEQIKLGKGYDHNFVLDGEAGTLRVAARVKDPASGRVLSVSTTEPGVQFYTGNFLDGSLTGKGGRQYKRRNAFCLETQHFPDSPNQPKFPTTVVKAGETRRSTTVFEFSAE